MNSRKVSAVTELDAYRYCDEIIAVFWATVTDEDARIFFKTWVGILLDAVLAGLLPLTLYKYRCLHIAERITGPRRFTLTDPGRYEATRIMAAANARMSEEVSTRIRAREAHMYLYEVLHGYVSVEQMRQNVFPSMPEDTYIGQELWNEEKVREDRSPRAVRKLRDFHARPCGRFYRLFQESFPPPS